VCGMAVFSSSWATLSKERSGFAYKRVGYQGRREIYNSTVGVNAVGPGGSYCPQLTRATLSKPIGRISGRVIRRTGGKRPRQQALRTNGNR